MHNLAREEVLHTEIPLIDVSVPRGAGAEVVLVDEPPIGERAVFLVLRTGEAARKGIGERGGAGLEVVGGKEHGRGFAESRARILEVCGYAHAVINAGAPAENSVGAQLIGKTDAWAEVVAIHGDAALVAIGKNGCAHAADR